MDVSDSQKEEIFKELLITKITNYQNKKKTKTIENVFKLIKKIFLNESNTTKARNQDYRTLKKCAIICQNPLDYYIDTFNYQGHDLGIVGYQGEASKNILFLMSNTKDRKWMTIPISSELGIDIIKSLTKLEISNPGLGFTALHQIITLIGGVEAVQKLLNGEVRDWYYKTVDEIDNYVIQAGVDSMEISTNNNNNNNVEETTNNNNNDIYWTEAQDKYLLKIYDEDVQSVKTKWTRIHLRWMNNQNMTSRSLSALRTRTYILKANRKNNNNNVEETSDKNNNNNVEETKKNNVEETTGDNNNVLSSEVCLSSLDDSLESWNNINLSITKLHESSDNYIRRMLYIIDGQPLSTKIIEDLYQFGGKLCDHQLFCMPVDDTDSEVLWLVRGYDHEEDSFILCWIKEKCTLIKTSKLSDVGFFITIGEVLQQYGTYSTSLLQNLNKAILYEAQFCDETQAYKNNNNEILMNNVNGPYVYGKPMISLSDKDWKQ